MKIKVFLTDLAAYNAGELHGKWVTFPVDDIQKTIQSVLKPGHEEYFITDYEAPKGIIIKESTNLEVLNELAKEVDELEDWEKEDLEMLLETGHFRDIEEAMQCLKSGDYRFYENCTDMGDVAMAVVEELGLLDSVPENLKEYFDYDKFGRDLEIDGSYYYIGEATYVEIFGMYA